MSAASTVPPDLRLRDPDGGATTSAALRPEDLRVVQLVRYFGCLPCQEWLLALDQAGPRLAALGATAAAVGGSADYQARWLRDEHGVTMPLLLDPDQVFRDAVGASRKLGARLLDPRGATAYLRSLRGGLRPQAITADTVQSPGVVVLDRDLRVRWQYAGRRIGDYPPLAEVERIVAGLARRAH